jgi:hypothetical protein
MYSPKNSNTLYNMTDFSFIRDPHTRHLISNGYTAVNQLELLGWLSNFCPRDREGFMWSSHPNIKKICDKMESLPDAPGHSGSSFAITMRHLEYIAKHGIEEYKVFMNLG